VTRAAGSGSHYTFVLLRPEGPDEHVKIELPSVTNILDCLSKPALVGWSHNVTVDGIAKLLAQDSLKGATSDELKGMLKERKLRPYDLRGTAADRGTHAHGILESLATGATNPEQVRAYFAERERENHEPPMDGFTAGVLKWWEETQPNIIAAEQPVWSLTYGFAGTFDILWMNGNGRIVLTDLKTSKAVYAEAHLQLAAYKLALEEMNPDLRIDKTTVLRTDAEGNYEHVTVEADPNLFLALIDVWEWQQEQEALRGK
jgi:hypothetical protein